MWIRHLQSCRDKSCTKSHRLKRSSLARRRRCLPAVSPVGAEGALLAPEELELLLDELDEDELEELEDELLELEDDELDEELEDELEELLLLREEDELLVVEACTN